MVEEGPPGIPTRLLRRRRARGRDGREGARPLRAAGLRPQADRPQPPRRPRPRGARRGVRRRGDGGSGGRDGRLLRARGRAVGARERGRAPAADDRRDLPARDEGARAGAAVRGRGLHGRADRPRGPRGGGRDDGRGAGLRSSSSSRSPTSTGSSSAREGRVRDADDAVGRRDRRDHHRAPRALPGHPCAEARRHLLRDVQPPVGGRRRCCPRSTCCS